MEKLQQFVCWAINNMHHASHNHLEDDPVTVTAAESLSAYLWTAIITISQLRYMH